MKYLITLLAALLLSAPASAGVAKPYIGANGVWYDQQSDLADFEGVLGLALSPQKIFAFVGKAAYGFENGYIRGSGGVRLTTSDPTNTAFSVGVGAQYHISNNHELRPQEWAGDVSIGLRPFADFTWLVAVAEYSYGLDSKLSQGTIGIRIDGSKL